MKKYFIAFMVSISVFMLQVAAQTKADKNAAAMSFEVTSHDFGNIKYADSAFWLFKYKNTGKEPLTISTAQASCGCTTPIWTREPVKKGKYGIIKVQYNTQIVGAFQKTVTVRSNAANSPIVLTIKGVVKPKEEQSKTY